MNNNLPNVLWQIFTIVLSLDTFSRRDNRLTCGIWKLICCLPAIRSILHWILLSSPGEKSLTIKISRNGFQTNDVIHILVRLYYEVSGCCYANVVRLRRSYHQCGTVRRNGRFDKTILQQRTEKHDVRNTVEKLWPRNTSYVTSSCSSLALHVFLFVIAHPRLSSSPLSRALSPSPLSLSLSVSFFRVRPRGLFREITETEDTSLARKCAGNGWEIIPHFLAAESTFETSTPRLHFSRAVKRDFHRERAIICPWKSTLAQMMAF